MLVTFAGTAGIIFNFHTMFGREAGVTLLMLLAALKVMELRNARDAMVLIYLACFIIITNFFYSQSISTALYLLATMTVIVATWVQLQAQSIALKPRLRIAAVLLMQALPLTLILFILFPRVQGPLWGLPQDVYGSTGLDDRMSPGSLSRLGMSEDVAFRVTYNDKLPRRDQMYWRGPVLWYFDGRTWTPGSDHRASRRNSPIWPAHRLRRHDGAAQQAPGCSRSMCRTSCPCPPRSLTISRSSTRNRSMPGCATRRVRIWFITQMCRNPNGSCSARCSCPGS